MFNPDPAIRFVPVTREQIVAIVESINQAQVQLPGRPTQTVFGHLCGVRNPNGTFSIYVSLHLPVTGENVVYAHDRRQLTVEEYREVEIEGLQFLESMGFMLDNLNFRNLAVPMQEQTLKRIPLFSPPRPPATGPAPAVSGPAVGSSDPSRVARLLCAF